MAEAVHHWLSHSMGYLFDVTSPRLGDSLYDGTVFHDILCKHNIVNPKNCPAPPLNPTTEVATQSLTDLGVWFKLLGITHSKDLLAAVAKKDSRAGLRILFELFARLETQEMTHFIMDQRATMLLQSGGRQFIVSKSEEPSKGLPPRPYYYELEDMLRNKKYIMEGYKNLKNTMENWTKTEMRRRREVVSKWAQRQTHLCTEDESPPPKTDPMDVFDKSLCLRPKAGWTDWTNAKYVAYLRQKRKKTVSNVALKMRMQETLVNDLWTEILDDRDKDLTEHFKEILLQPCKHEQQLVNTLKKTHENYKNFAHFSAFVNDQAEEKYTQAEKKFQVDKPEHEASGKAKEKQRVLELHQRLWEEKLRVKRENHVIWCRRTVVDLIDYAVKVGEHKAEFHVEPSQKLLDEWKELFFKELPITREPRNFIRNLYEDNAPIRPEILLDMLEEENKDPFPGHSQQFAKPVTSEIRKIDPPSKLIEESTNWTVLMDYDNISQAFSTARVPDFLTLESKTALFSTEAKKKCKDDMECLLDLSIVDCLNNFNLRTYLNLFGPWDLKQWPGLWPELPYDEKMNVLGYAVHRLLDLKYPMPKGPKPPRLPPFQIKAILGTFTDEKAAYVLESLKDLLAKEEVEVIDVSIPVNYCLNAYRGEMEITEFGSVLKNKKSRQELDVAMTILWKYPYRRWERRVPKYPERPPKKGEPQALLAIQSTKTAASPELKTSGRKSVTKRQSTGGKSGSSGHKSSPSPIRYGYLYNKATQIPSIPDLSKRYKHSPAGRLGKLAFETLAEGKQLNDVLLGNMLIEYLKTLYGKRGFVLVNFPLSALQANIFENLFTGQAVQYPLKWDSEVDLFKTADFPDSFSHVRSFMDFDQLLFNYVKEQEPPVELLEIPLREDRESKHEHKSAEKSPAGGKPATGRKSAAGRKSATPRKSKTARKSAAGRKSTTPRKSKSDAGKKPSGIKVPKSEPKIPEPAAPAEPEPPKPPTPPPKPEPPKTPPTLEELRKLRQSEIVPQTSTDLDALLYGTSSYFSTYVNPLQMQAFRQNQAELARVKKGPFDQNPARMLINEQTKPLPFYKRLGIVKDFDYMRFDSDTIKRLARVILGAIWDPDDIERKPSIEMFGVGNLEKVERGAPLSVSSGSSQASRTSFYDAKEAKFKKLDDAEVKYKDYAPIKPPPPPPPLPPPPQPVESEPEPEKPDKRRKSAKRQSMKRQSQSPGKRQSKSPGKRQSKSPGKRQSTARKSKTPEKRQSTARKSKTPGKRQSMKRQSKVGDPKTSTGGKKPEVQKEKEPSIVVVPKPKPGEPGWVYINEPIPYEIGHTAATEWECTENVYVETMEKIFYLLRMHDAKILPYETYVRNSLKNIIKEDVDKRHLVTNFQLMLNKMADDESKNDAEVKHELHVRVNELNDILSGIALKRRVDSLEKKAELISQGWMVNHAYTLANLYLSMMQAEMDLCANAMQVLYDYYMSILGEIPNEDRQPRVILERNRMAMEDITADIMSLTAGRRRRRTTSKVSLPRVTLRRSLIIPMQIQNFLLKTNQAASSGDSTQPPEPNPTHQLIEHAGVLKSGIGALKDYYEGVIKNPDVGKEARGRIFGAPAGALVGSPGTPVSTHTAEKPVRKSMAKRQSTARKSKSGGSRKSQAGKRKSQAGGKRASQAGKRASQAGKRASQAGKRASQAGKRASQAGKRASQAGKRASQVGKSTKKGRAPDEPEGPDTVDVAKEEWAAAVGYQAARSEFRLKLIEARAKKDLDLLLDMVRDLFIDYQSIVDNQLMKEASAIRDCIYFFKRAIEEGLPIQPLVVLDDNKFYIDRKVLLFPDPPPPPPTPLVEVSSPFSFTVEQLKTIVTKFSQMAPMGVIETPMIQTLSEMAIAGHETGKPTIPAGWSQLDSFDYKAIIVEAFADQTCIDWRNFTLNIAELPYPNIEQLLLLKKQYREQDANNELLMSWQTFSDIPLWFESEFGETIEEDLKLSLAKGLIFNMFKINNQEMNYFDMLIGYCRAEDPEDGLGMALDLLMDTGYILEPDKCVREDESDKIHPRKIIDFILVNFLKDLLDLTDTVQLKYLPRLTNQEVFASEDNEFELSEDILRQNQGKKADFGDLSSTDSESNRPKPERYLYLDDDDELPAKYNCDKWQMCVPYEIALALLSNALNFYAFSPTHHHRILDVEDRLKALYRDKGTGTHLKAYRLTTSDLFKELFAKTAIFRKTNIIKLAEELVGKKQGTTGPIQ